jgi:hypothetical protein
MTDRVIHVKQERGFPRRTFHVKHFDENECLD